MANEDLTAQRLRELLDYDPDTGVFIRVKSQNKVTGNSSHPRGYIAIRVDYRRYYAHRLAWLYVYGVWPSYVIDHINGIPNDNRIQNLRDVRQTDNLHNIRQKRPGLTSNLIGVSFRNDMGKYVAQIRIDGKQTYIGSYGTEGEARDAYLASKRLHHSGFVE